MKKVAFCTLGCKVNQYETNAMEQKFLQAGYQIKNFNEKADIYIINTCTVTNMSDKKSRQMIRKAKQLNKNAIVVAVGCYVQTAKEELENIKELDLILGNNEKKDIVQYVEKHQNGIMQIKYNDVLQQDEYDEYGFVTHIEQTRAIVKVQDGCDRFCSYCAIPYARGKVRSRKLENIIEEVTKLAQNGIKEVVITGIHIASYGKDFNENIRLIDVLEKINEIDGIQRIRLGSLEPMLINEDFLNRLSKLDKICHHFHLSLQSGCDETLKRMNRRYTTDEFRNVVNLLRNTYDDVILTTDIIVGFPGETEEEFGKTYEFLKEVKFYKMHVFKYSKRSGTKAATMPNQIKPEIQEKRSKRLIELSDINQKEYNKEYIGKTLEVLFEEQNGEYIKGHTQNYIVVNVKGNISSFHNEIINVKIVEMLGDELLGIA
jgi:threonylcarbamoyladenosine tRNA methylthiotransferase MtaB